MSKRDLYAPKALQRPAGYQWEPPSNALARWAENQPQAAADSTEISVYEPIGDDGWGGGFSARKMAAILRSLGTKPVTVAINSPGGDMFEGLAIYNMLREHPEAVTVKVRGIAASAASIIAMAGDEIIMGQGAFLMIHNAWGLVIGNRNDFSTAAAQFAEFDDAMAGIYEKRTGMKREDVAAMMDAETFLSAETALAKGFADSIFDDDNMGDAAQDRNPENRAKAARQRLDAMLAQQGVPRSERRAMLRDVSGMPGAADPVMPGADDIPAAAMLSLAASFRSFNSRK
jgi:ATP-dependent Clp protease, protease subunit